MIDMNKVHWVNFESLPFRDYRQVAYFAADIREIAKRIGGVSLHAGRNDLGDYLALALEVDGVPIKLVGMVPFIAEEFSVFSDPSDSSKASSVVLEILEKLGIRAERIENKWK